MKIFWFDTETSGLNSHKHGIFQLSYILKVDGKLHSKDTLYSNCNTKEITDKALEITGYNPKEIAEFPPPELMYKKLKALFTSVVDPYNKTDKMIGAGYNVNFDLDFLRQLWFDNGDKFFGSFFAHGAIDPAALFRYMQYIGLADQSVLRITLSDLCDYFAIDSSKAHDAEADIAMTKTLYEKMNKIIREEYA